MMSSTPIITWIREHATPVATDLTAPLSDLEPLRQVVGDAQVVGLGESTHGAHEQFALKQRIVRLLVEELGFRGVALEEDWTKGVQIDEYLKTGTGDPDQLVADAGAPWRTEEIVQLVTWMRSFNQAHPDDPVRFAGVDVVAVRPLAYDAVAEYVERAAPNRAGELEEHFAAIRPRGDIQHHVGWLHTQPDKQPLLDHARHVQELIRSLPRADGHSLALHYAKIILAFYTYHAQQRVAVRDQHMAENLAWWRDLTGSKVAYWAANVHTANGPRLSISYPPFPPAQGQAAGARLRERYGSDYVSIGMTFHHGTVNVGWNPPQPHDVPETPANFAESTLANGGPKSFVLDLHAPAPDEVRTWLDAPATVRVIGPTYEAAKDADYHMSGGSLREWFDLVVHIGEVTPTRLLPWERSG
jgi:erythromycin esterase